MNLTLNGFKTLSTKLLVAVLIISFFGFGLTTNEAKAQVTTSYQPQNTLEYLAFLYGRLLQLQLQLQAIQRLQAEGVEYSDVSSRRNINPYFMQVDTMTPSAIGRSTVELQSRVDVGSSKKARAWFEYGVGTNLNKRTDKVNLTNTRQKTAKVAVIDLRSGTKYSYRAILEDEDGNIIRGEIWTFNTIDKALQQSFSGKPVVETEGVINVGATSAEIKGFVSMNDYGDGTAFFVYSKDRSQVEDVEDYDNYVDIPVVRGQLIKQIVEKELTERSTVSAKTRSMVKATKYYYRVCVEYPDDRDDLNLVCSDTEWFVTSN